MLSAFSDSTVTATYAKSAVYTHSCSEAAPGHWQQRYLITRNLTQVFPKWLSISLPLSFPLCIFFVHTIQPSLTLILSLSFPFFTSISLSHFNHSHFHFQRMPVCALLIWWRMLQWQHRLMNRTGDSKYGQKENGGAFSVYSQAHWSMNFA